MSDENEEININMKESLNSSNIVENNCSKLNITDIELQNLQSQIKQKVKDTELRSAFPLRGNTFKEGVSKRDTFSEIESKGDTFSEIEKCDDKKLTPESINSLRTSNTIDIEDDEFSIANQSPPKSEITKREVDFLKKIIKKASESKKKQLNKAKKYETINEIFSFSVSVLALLAGSSGIGGIYMLNEDNEAYPILITTSILSMLGGLIGITNNVLKFNNKVNIYKSAVYGYTSIINRISKFLSTPGTDRKDVEIFTNEITLEMNVINYRELL